MAATRSPDVVLSFRKTLIVTLLFASFSLDTANVINSWHHCFIIVKVVTILGVEMIVSTPEVHVARLVNPRIYEEGGGVELPQIFFLGFCHTQALGMLCRCIGGALSTQVKTK